MNFTIRKALLNDDEAVYEMICDLEEQKLNRNSFSNIYRKNVSNSPNRYFIIENEKSIIGFINIHIKSILHHADEVAEIEEFIIKEDLRSSGIGGQIIKYIIDMLKNENILNLELVSNMRRDKAHRFYEKNGFIKSHYGFTMNLK
jgi:(aminoalkyl)phosphonate N-acetyltransferase